MNLFTLLFDQINTTFHFQAWHHQCVVLRHTVLCLKKKILYFLFKRGLRFFLIFVYVLLIFCYFGDLHLSSIQYASLLYCLLINSCTAQRHIQNYNIHMWIYLWLRVQTVTRNIVALSITNIVNSRLQQFIKTILLIWFNIHVFIF